MISFESSQYFKNILTAAVSNSNYVFLSSFKNVWDFSLIYFILMSIFSAYSPIIHAAAYLDSSSEDKSIILIIKLNTFDWLYFY